LPAGLPSEQVSLMFAYMGIAQEERGRSKDGRFRQKVREADAELQQAEKAAWAARKQVSGG
jgi:hypothetical protein